MRSATRLGAALAATAAAALAPSAAQAVVVINAYEQGADVIFKATGSLSLPSNNGTSNLCAGPAGAGFVTGATVRFASSSSASCSSSKNAYTYTFSNSLPTSFAVATSSSGTEFFLNSSLPRLVIDAAPNSSVSVDSTLTFANQTLASLGLTTLNTPLETWILANNETINFVALSSPPGPSNAVPGPLPLMGAVAAFRASRRLRRRTRPQG
jgi:hypothetical protein